MAKLPHIKIEYKSVFFPAWHTAGIRTIGDILNHNNQIMLPDELSNEYGIKIEFLSLQNAIPYSWRNLYWGLLEQKYLNPIPSEHNWINSFGIDPDNLRKFYCVPYHYNRKTKIQTLQCEILMNIYLPMWPKIVAMENRPDL